MDGLAVNGDKLLVVHTNPNYVMEMCKVTGKQLRSFDGITPKGPASLSFAGRFRLPTKICIFDEYLFISDTFCNRIHMLRLSDGAMIRTFQGSFLTRPTALAVVGDEIIVCVHDQGGASSLIVMDRDSGVLLKRWNGTPAWGLVSGLCSWNGQVYILSSLHNKVIVMT